MMGVSSGLELLTLPHGHQLRLDLLERLGNTHTFTYTYHRLQLIRNSTEVGNTPEEWSVINRYAGSNAG